MLANTVLDPPTLVPLFLIYDLGQGLAQPALINVVMGSAGFSGAGAVRRLDCS